MQLPPSAEYVASLRRAIARHPLAVGPLGALGKVHLARREYPPALTVLSRCLMQMGPGHRERPVTLLCLGRAYLGVGRNDGALRLTIDALNAGLDEALWLRRAESQLCRLGRHEQALKVRRRAVYLERNATDGE